VLADKVTTHAAMVKAGFRARVSGKLVNFRLPVVVSFQLPST
jgi:hypothetical protein